MHPSFHATNRGNMGIKLNTSLVHDFLFYISFIQITSFNSYIFSRNYGVKILLSFTPHNIYDIGIIPTQYTEGKILSPSTAIFKTNKKGKFYTLLTSIRGTKFSFSFTHYSIRDKILSSELA